MRITATLVVLPLVLAHAAAPGINAHPNTHRRHHARLIAGRADNSTDTETGGGSSSSDPPASSSSSSSVVVESSSTPSPSSSSRSTAPPSSSTPPPTPASSSSSTPPPSSSSSEAPVSSSSAISSDSAVSDTSASVTPSPVSDTAVVASPSPSRSTGTGTFSLHNTMSVGKSIVTNTRTATASASLAADNNDDDKSSGLPKGALIAIIVCAVILGVGLIAWTLFRKWKLRPSKGFDQRMQPIDFSPNNNADMGDDFFEKTMARDADAERQRQQFVTELDKDATLVGDIHHDFTAGPAAGAYGYQGYAADPYGHNDFSQPRQDWDYTHGDAAGYPPQPNAGYYPDYPTQDSPPQVGSYDNSNHGHYSDLQRGPSVGGEHAPHQPPFDPLGGSDFSVSGRPTDSSAGAASPYAQAATYRY